jgi:L-lactate dehydrogenase complex protein LldF
MMNMGSQKTKNWVVNHLIKGWAKNRNEIDFPVKTFNQLWQERKKKPLTDQKLP